MNRPQHVRCLPDFPPQAAAWEDEEERLAHRDINDMSPLERRAEHVVAQAAYVALRDACRYLTVIAADRMALHASQSHMGRLKDKP